jgi:hypothetical protein
MRFGLGPTLIKCNPMGSHTMKTEVSVQRKTADIISYVMSRNHTSGVNARHLESKANAQCHLPISIHPQMHPSIYLSLNLGNYDIG